MLDAKTWAYVGIAGLVLSIVLLAAAGKADLADSYRTFILASSIVLGAAIIARGK